MILRRIGAALAPWAALLLIIPGPAAAGPGAGLWIGQIEITGVNEVGSKTDTATPRPVANPFDMKILLHEDAGGQVRLLRAVTVMQKRYSEAGAEKVRRVLITDETLLPGYEGVVRRDGKLTGFRLAGAAFDFDPASNSLPLSGSIAAGAAVTGSVYLGKNHPTNPFRHLYHPDHREGREITRTVTLSFDADQGAGTPDAGWMRLTGHYTETLTGLHKIPLAVAGAFTLKRVSRIGTLNDQ